MGQPTHNPVSTKPRLVGLDLLRLLAIVFVLGRHTELPPESWPSFLRWLLVIWHRGGWVGVDLFFVLSGFLVSGLLFGEYKSKGRLGIGRFFIRRGWKIYPPFLVLIVATILFNVSFGRSFSRGNVIAEFAFIQNYWFGLWGHTWSLAVEEHFYLLLPLALFLILRWNRASPNPLMPILALAAFTAAAALALRILNWQLRPPFEHRTHIFPTHLRLDSLFFGVAISYCYHFHQDGFVKRLRPWRRRLIVGGALLLAPAFVFPIESTPFVYTLGLTVFFVGSGMMLVGVLLSELSLGRAGLALATLGAFSYSIYLWHMPVKRWGAQVFERLSGTTAPYSVELLAYLIGSLVVGVVMAKLVEAPALRLRDRLFPAPKSQDVQVEASSPKSP